MTYDEISKLLNKYSTKQSGERWSKRTEKRKDKIIELNRKYRLFDGINSEYFHLQGTKIDRVKYLIKQLNFNEVNPKCSSEQIIIMICYFVNREYNVHYKRKNCKRVFKDYGVTSDMLDGFMVFLATYGINNTILDKNFLLNTQ